MVFYSDYQADGSASIVKEFRPGSPTYGKQFVPIFNTEALAEIVNFENMSILKIDVEGAEYEVLLSFEKEIKKYQPIILIEILPVYSSEMQERLKSQKGIEKLMSDLDYSIYKVATKEKTLTGVNKLKEIGIHSNIDHCDYVLVPATKVAVFEKYCQEQI